MTGIGYIEEHKLSSSYPNNCGEDLKMRISRIQNNMAFLQDMHFQEGYSQDCCPVGRVQETDFKVFFKISHVCQAPAG